MTGDVLLHKKLLCKIISLFSWRFRYFMNKTFKMMNLTSKIYASSRFAFGRIDFSVLKIIYYYIFQEQWKLNQYRSDNIRATEDLFIAAHDLKENIPEKPAI